MTAKCPFTPGSESPRVINYLRKVIQRKYGMGKQLRVFHAKTIGVVKGTLTVPDLSSNKKLAIGLFKTEGVYDLAIRFTNGRSTVVPDGKTAVHGMAIKVMTPENEKYFDKSAKTQDIILSNVPVFYPYQPDAVYPSMKAILAPGLIGVYYLVQVALKDFLAAVGFITSRKNSPNLLEEIYYSATPYKYGTKDKIKWSAWPSKVVCSVLPESPHGDNFLTERMRYDLDPDRSASPINDTVVNQPHESSEKTIDYRVKFTLCVQFQEDENTEPIEDCSVEWKTKFHPVGVIKIPAQHVEYKENEGIDYGLWYSPANALEDHAPLGFVNLVRAQAYTTLARERLFPKP